MCPIEIWKEKSGVLKGSQDKRLLWLSYVIIRETFLGDSIFEMVVTLFFIHFIFFSFHFYLSKNLSSVINPIDFRSSYIYYKEFLIRPIKNDLSI